MQSDKAWKTRIVGHDRVDPSQLTANPNNHRLHPVKQQKVIRGSLEELGIIKSVIVNKRTGLLVDGHERLEVVIKAKDIEVVSDGISETDSTWRFDKPVRNAEHPTMKPVELCARAISHGSKRGGTVLDGFLGSGSTLIAAEQLGRRCIGTELDPKYCDAILARWEKATGGTATLEAK